RHTRSKRDWSSDVCSSDLFYNSTRKLVLKGADGVVFVADSQGKMLEANVESYKNLEDNLREMGLRIEEIPLVMQFNKRDLPHLRSEERRVGKEGRSRVGAA